MNNNRLFRALVIGGAMLAGCNPPTGPGVTDVPTTTETSVNDSDSGISNDDVVQPPSDVASEGGCRLQCPGFCWG